MLYKIHNPRPATQGIWVSGQRVMVRSGAGLILEMGEDDAQRAARRVTVEAIGQEQVEFQEVEPSDATIDDGPTLPASELNLDVLTDNQLRDLAKSKGIKVHHKAGRAKLLDALT